METRFELAQARQAAKAHADEERKKNKFSENSSIALKIVSFEELNVEYGNVEMFKCVERLC